MAGKRHSSLLAALGFVWLIFWWLGTGKLQPLGDAAVAAANPSEKGPPWSQLLKERRTWAVAGAKLLTDLVWWFILFWAPDFFAQQFGLGQAEIGAPTALAYALAAVGALTSGMLFPLLLRRGMTPNAARKSSMFFYALMILPFPLALYAPNQWVAALLLAWHLFAHQGFSTNIFGMTADIIPARQVGSVIAIGALAGNLSGAAMLEFAGWSLDSGSWLHADVRDVRERLFAGVAWIHLMQPKLEVVNSAE